MDEMQRYTGRSFVLFKRALGEQYEQQFNRLMERLQAFPRFTPTVEDSRVDDKGHLYAQWGVAIVPYSPERVVPLIGDPDLGIEKVENERFVYATSVAAAVTTAQPVTPGLKLTKVDVSSETGKGVRVAVLDTGFDFTHPDFPASRFGGMQPFTGDPVQDSVHGHGTHTTGTACGPLTSAGGRRYGIAYESSIYVARVLDPAGLGFDQWVLDAIAWAQSPPQQVHIVQMCFGSPAGGGTACMERVASGALADGILLVAAAGNRNNNPWPQPPHPIDYPANCPSIFAVAAVTNQLLVTAYCCGGLFDGKGGEVNIAAPGENVYSATTKRGGYYYPANGTSMATAHVTGIAALRCKGGSTVGRALWSDIESYGEKENTIDYRYFSGKLAVAP